MVGWQVVDIGKEEDGQKKEGKEALTQKPRWKEVRKECGNWTSFRTLRCTVL